MNPAHPTDDHPFDDPALEREWQAQEQALRAERTHADGTHDDMRLRSYRAIARALREPLPSALPADFDAQLAQRVASQAAKSADAAFVTPFERVVIGAAIALFGLAIGIGVVLSAAEALQPAGDALRQVATWGSNRWLVALAACLLVSTALQRWPRKPLAHAN